MRNPIISLCAFIILINTCFCSPASGQKEFGFKMPENTRKITIPFELHNNLVIIPITINRFLTLKFILDTGVENAILTEKLFGDLLEVNYLREITIDGPGLADSVQAYVANEVIFDLPGGVVGNNMNLLVLKEDYLKLSENIGDNVHGIIGYDIFSRFVVNINYDEREITLIDPKKFRKVRRATAVPIEIRSTKPFLSAKVNQDNQEAALDIMIDTGASHAALMDYNYISGIDIPSNTITTRLGRGIAGEIPGYMCRLDTIQIQKFLFKEMLVSAPFAGAYNKVIKRGASVGTIGGELLYRFDVTFDYHNQMMYLKKGERYKDAFEFDMSGLELNAAGSLLDTLKVVGVDPETPALQADIRPGDVLQSLNGRNLKTHSLSEINQLLQSKDGKLIKCLIYRDGEKVRTSFRLKRMI
ncbi:MAG: aspartyl protease family protein [Ekhidna sp.]|nr:aspartyl protease family protein [Ekhidna sp.]